MKGRLARFFALSSAVAFAATLEGATSRIELSGGPITRSGAKVLRHRPVAPVVARAAERPVRPLAPGEMLVLGLTAGPSTAPPIPLEAPPLAAPPAAISRAVDTVTVRAPASPVSAAVPEAARAPAVRESWDSYRSGNVVRVTLPGD